MKVGIVGYGLMGKRRRKTIDVADELVGWSDPMVAESQSLSVLSALGANVMVVSTPTHLLAENTIECIKQGAKRILVEKPCAATANEWKEVLLEAKATGVIVVPGYTLRHNIGIRQVQRAIASNKHGTPMYARMLYGHGGGASGWRAERAAGGELLDQCSHLIDLSQWFFDDMHLVANQLLCQVTEDVEDNVLLWLEGKDHRAVNVSLHASWTEWKPVFRLEVICERAEYIMHGLGTPTYGPQEIVVRSKEKGVAEEHLTYTQCDDLGAEWKYFREVDRAGADRLCEYTLRTLQLIDEVKR